MLGGVLQRIGNYILPEYCLGCSKEGASVCTTCSSGLHVFDNPCAQSSTHRALWWYSHTSLPASVLKEWKYANRHLLGKFFCTPIARFVNEQQIWFRGIESLVPIPLHPRRFAERGFNQAEEIARFLGETLGVPLLAHVQRVKKTKSQATLSKKERLQNVSNIFRVDCSLVQDRILVVVDDVYTTGATMGEMAKVLYGAGAKEVRFFSLFKDPLPTSKL